MIEEINSLTFDIIKSIGELINKNKTLRKILSIVLIILTSIMSLIIIYAVFFITEKDEQEHILNNILPFFFVPCAVIVFFFLVSITSSANEIDDLQLEKIRTEREVINKQIEKEEKSDIFSTIKLSLNQLNEYYTINKSQARSSFRFSVFAIVIGLITIISGIWFMYLGYGNTQTTIITTISGGLLEFIGGAYFFMYKKSLEQVNFFFNKLIKIQDTMLAIKLSEEVKNEDKQYELTEKIISSLLERSLK